MGKKIIERKDVFLDGCAGIVHRQCDTYLEETSTDGDYDVFICEGCGGTFRLKVRNLKKECKFCAKTYDADNEGCPHCDTGE